MPRARQSPERPTERAPQNAIGAAGTSSGHLGRLCPPGQVRTSCARSRHSSYSIVDRRVFCRPPRRQPGGKARRSDLDHLTHDAPLRPSPSPATDPWALVEDGQQVSGNFRFPRAVTARRSDEGRMASRCPMVGGVDRDAERIPASHRRRDHVSAMSKRTLPTAPCSTASCAAAASARG